MPFGADGKPLSELNLHPLFQAILDIAINETLAVFWPKIDTLLQSNQAAS